MLVQTLAFPVTFEQGGIRVQGLGLRVKGVGFKDEGLKLRLHGFWFRV